MRDAYSHVFATSPDLAERLEKPRYRQIVDAAFEVGEVLYGVWTWDRLIKIGYTTRIWQRLGAYGINHANVADRILFVAAGTFAEEQIIHYMLSDHVERGQEYYRPTEEVLDIVNQLRARCSLEPMEV